MKSNLYRSPSLNPSMAHPSASVVICSILLIFFHFNTLHFSCFSFAPNWTQTKSPPWRQKYKLMQKEIIVTGWLQHGNYRIFLQEETPIIYITQIRFHHLNPFKCHTITMPNWRGKLWWYNFLPDNKFIT